MSKEIKQQNIESKGPKKKLPYPRPVLHVFGDVRDLTLGGSPGIGDSGSGAGPQQPPL